MYHCLCILLNSPSQLCQFCSASPLLLWPLPRARSSISRSLCSRTSPNPSTSTRKHYASTISHRPTSQVKGYYNGATCQFLNPQSGRNHKPQHKRRHKFTRCINHPVVTSDSSISPSITVHSYQSKPCRQRHRSTASVHRQNQRTQRTVSYCPTPRCPRIPQFPAQQDCRRDGRRQKERRRRRHKWSYNGCVPVERRPYVPTNPRLIAHLLTFCVKYPNPYHP